MAVSYTDAQIQEVCDIAASVMKDFTDVQNCTFPSAAIIAGMKAGKTAQEIASDAYDAVSELPLHQTGYGLVGTGDSMRNIAKYMQVSVLKAIENIPVPEEPKEDEPGSP